MMLPLWVRCLPHNLATIRPRFALDFDLRRWIVGLTLYANLDPGDEDYPFHYDSSGMWILLGPLHLGFLLVDTPGTDCEESLRLKEKEENRCLKE